MLLELQIRILEWFAMNRVTLKTVKIMKIQLCHHMNKFYNKIKYIKIENSCQNIKIVHNDTVLLYVWSNKCSLDECETSFKKCYKNKNNN